LDISLAQHFIIYSTFGKGDLGDYLWKSKNILNNKSRKTLKFKTLIFAMKELLLNQKVALVT